MKNITSYPSSLNVSCHTPRRLPLDPQFSFLFSLSILSHAFQPSTRLTLYLFLLHLLFLAFMRPYVPCVAQRVRTPYSFFSVTMPSGAWRAEQFRVRDYASRAILQLIGSAGRTCAEAYLIACSILNYEKCWCIDNKLIN